MMHGQTKISSVVSRTGKVFVYCPSVSIESVSATTPRLHSVRIFAYCCPRLLLNVIK